MFMNYFQNVQFLTNLYKLKSNGLLANHNHYFYYVRISKTSFLMKYAKTLIFSLFYYRVCIYSVNANSCEDRQRESHHILSDDALNLLNGPLLNPTQIRYIKELKTSLPIVKNIIRVRKENSNVQNDDENNYFLYPQQNGYIGESIIKGIVSKWNSWFHKNESYVTTTTTSTATITTTTITTETPTTILDEEATKGLHGYNHTHLACNSSGCKSLFIIKRKLFLHQRFSSK